jgi:hypothetical protein
MGVTIFPAAAPEPGKQKLSSTRLEKWWGPVVLEARLLPLSFYPLSSEQKSSGGAGSMPAAPDCWMPSGDYCRQRRSLGGTVFQQ